MVQKNNNVTRFGALILIFLVLLGVAFYAESKFQATRYEYPMQQLGMMPLQVQGGWFCVRVLDDTTGNPVKDVYVELDWTFSGQGNDYGKYTDNNGECGIAVPLGSYYVTLTHPDYQTYTSSLKTITTTASTWFVFKIVKGVVSGGVTVTIYLLDSYKKRITSGGVTYLGAYHPVGQDGKIKLYHVVSGSVMTLDVKGQWMRDFFDWPQFAFTVSFTAPNIDQTYTIWIEDKIVEMKEPPAQPADLGTVLTIFYQIFTWLVQNWWIALGLGVLIYFTPYILNMVTAFKRTRPPIHSSIK